MADIQVGDRVKFRRLDGVIATDTVRALFTQTTMLEPYARNEQASALVLTKHSWCFVSDVVRVVKRITALPS